MADNLISNTVYMPLSVSSYETEVTNKIQLLQNGISSLQSETEKYSNIVINELNSYLKQLEDNAQALFALMGYKDDVETNEKNLNARIKALNSEVPYLNGEELKKFMYDYVSKVAAVNPGIDRQESYEKFLWQVVKEGAAKLEMTVIPQVLRDIEEKELYKIINAYFGHTFKTEIDLTQEKVKNESGKYALRPGSISTDVSQISGRLREEFEYELNRQVRSQNKGKRIKKEVRIIPTKKELAKIAITIDDTNYGAAMKMSDEDFMAIVSNSDVLDQLNIFLTDYISSKAAQPALMRQCINNMLSQKRDMFRIKGNLKDLTGTLGEIQGMYYVANLFPNIQARWSGSDITKGVKPHSDIILQNEGRHFGIQVKNSVRAVNDLKVNFESFKLFLNQQNPGYTFSDKKIVPTVINSGGRYSIIFEAIAALLGMRSFNVPYIWNLDEHEAQSTEIGNLDTNRENTNRYVTSYNTLHNEKITDLINAATTLIMATAMFMQFDITDLSQMGNQNTLYLIGGVLALTAYSLLKQTIEEVKQRIYNFTISGNVKKRIKGEDKGTQMNIIDYINSGHGTHNDIETYIELTSSYNFTTS